MGSATYPIAHLTEIPWYHRAAARIDQMPVLGWVFGSVGVILLPLAPILYWIVRFIVRELLSYEIPVPPTGWWASALVLLQAMSGLVAHGAKKHSELVAGTSAVRSLREFLDLMHSEVCIGNTNSRLSLLVPVKRRNRCELRVFLRPKVFPSVSETRLEVEGNSGIKEGVAGLCYCGGKLETIIPQSDPKTDREAYAMETHIPLNKLDTLKRLPRYLMAMRIDGSNGDYLGVLVVDNLVAGRILDNHKEQDCKRAERQIAFLIPWIREHLSRVPEKIRHRASEDGLGAFPRTWQRAKSHLKMFLP